MKRDLLAVVLIAAVGLFVLGAAGPGRGDVGRWQVVVGAYRLDGSGAVVLVDTVTGRTFWRGPGAVIQHGKHWMAVPSPDETDKP